eukprot:gene17408-24064_t
MSELNSKDINIIPTIKANEIADLPYADIRSKSNYQISESEKRLIQIGQKIDRMQNQTMPNNKVDNKGWDWSKSYEQWSGWDDLEELKYQKVKEENKIEELIKSADAFTGHNHDHSMERKFFESPENEKIIICEHNRTLGNYLFHEGMIVKAAEHYQLAIVYYEYCFPDDKDTQARLDTLRYACLCNIALCYIRMKSFRLAIDAVNRVIQDTRNTHSKALFRRAQAYRHLDEYDLAMSDVIKALELSPRDKSIIDEISLLK